MGKVDLGRKYVDSRLWKRRRKRRIRMERRGRVVEGRRYYEKGEGKGEWREERERTRRKLVKKARERKIGKGKFEMKI